MWRNGHAYARASLNNSATIIDLPSKKRLLPGLMPWLCVETSVTSRSLQVSIDDVAVRPAPVARVDLRV